MKIPNCPPHVSNWKEVLNAGLANNETVKSLYKYHQNYFFKMKQKDILQKLQMSGQLPMPNGNNNNNNNSNNNGGNPLPSSNNNNNNSNNNNNNFSIENSARYITAEQQKALLETAQVLLRNLQKQGKVPMNLSNEEYNLYIKRYFNEFAQKRLGQLKQQQQQLQQKQNMNQGMNNDNSQISAAQAAAAAAQQKRLQQQQQQQQQQHQANGNMPNATNTAKPMCNQQLLSKLNQYFTPDEQKNLIGQARTAIKASQQKGSLNANLTTEETQMLIKRFVYGIITKKEQQIQQQQKQRSNTNDSTADIKPHSQPPIKNPIVPNSVQPPSATLASAPIAATVSKTLTAPSATTTTSAAAAAPSANAGHSQSASNTPLPTIKSNNPLFEDYSNLHKLSKLQKNLDLMQKKRKEVYHYSQADIFMETLNNTMFGINNKQFQHQPMINLQPHVVDFINNTGKKKLTKTLLKQRDQENIKVEIDKTNQRILIDFKDQITSGMNHITTGNPYGIIPAGDYKEMFGDLSNDTKVLRVLLEEQKKKKLLEQDLNYHQPKPFNLAEKRKMNNELTSEEKDKLKKLKTSTNSDQLYEKHKSTLSNSEATTISFSTNENESGILNSKLTSQPPNPEIDDVYSFEYWQRVQTHENVIKNGMSSFI